MEFDIKVGFGTAPCEVAKKRLAKNLRNLRLRRKMTQAELADAAGVNRVSVLRIERHQRMGSIETLVLLAAALNTSPGRLLDDDPVPE